MGKLDGKVALVTGGSRGIGKGIARGLAVEGADLVLASRDQSALVRTAKELEGEHCKAIGVPTDVSDEVQVEALFGETMDRFGRLDILVNNAGAFDGGPIEDLSADAWDNVIAVNLRAPFLCTRAAFPIMKEQGGGKIINIGSISAQRVRPNSAPYSTSKFGIWGVDTEYGAGGQAVWDRLQLPSPGKYTGGKANRFGIGLGRRTYDECGRTR